MRFGFFLFFISLPFFAALGFDYFDYQMNPKEGFHFNKLGTLWAQNFRDSYLSAKNAISPENWKALSVILRQPAAVVGFVFAHVIYVSLALAKIISWFINWNKQVRAEEKHGHKTQDVSDLDFLSKNKSSKYKYKYKYKK